MKTYEDYIAQCKLEDPKTTLDTLKEILEREDYTDFQKLYAFGKVLDHHKEDYIDEIKTERSEYGKKFHIANDKLEKLSQRYESLVDVFVKFIDGDGPKLPDSFKKIVKARKEEAAKPAPKPADAPVPTGKKRIVIKVAKKIQEL